MWTLEDVGIVLVRAIACWARVWQMVVVPVCNLACRTDVMDMFNDGGPLISVLSKDVLKLDPVDGVIRSIIPFKLGA